MKLNHESYEKAFSNITLDDRIGMELLSNAKVKRLRRKKKNYVTGGSGYHLSGVGRRSRNRNLLCTDSTDPIHFFAMMFQHASMELFISRRWFCRK